MLIKNLLDEDFVNYKKVSMFIGCHSCSFKCDKLAGKNICQNSCLAKSPDIDIDNKVIVQRYLNNYISKSIVFGGLEPFDDIDNVIDIISLVRENNNMDDIVIYTGYTKEEITSMFRESYEKLINLKNVVIKYGRFIPNNTSRYDDVLGVTLHSDNQFAERLS